MFFVVALLLTFIIQLRFPKNLIQERVSQLVCKGNKTECEKLMQKTVTTHQYNLQLLMTEICKTKHSLNPTFIRDIFTEGNNQYNLRNENHLQLPAAKATTYGLETMEYRGCLCGPYYQKKLKIPGL